MSVREEISNKLAKRINDVLSDYHQTGVDIVRRDLNQLVTNLDALLPPSAEKISIFRRLLEAAHHITDAVEMQR